MFIKDFCYMYFEDYKSTFTYGNSGGTYSIGITFSGKVDYNTLNARIEIGNDLLSNVQVAHTSGYNGTLTFTLSENTSNGSRTGSIVVSFNDRLSGTMYYNSVVINQASTYDTAQLGADFDHKYLDNQSFESEFGFDYINIDRSTLSVSTDSIWATAEIDGLNIKYSVKANIGTAIRSCIISLRGQSLITGAWVVSNIVLIQDYSNTLPLFILDTTSIDVPSGETYCEIGCKYGNIKSFNIHPDDDSRNWLNVDSVPSDNKIKFTASENTGWNRKGTIIIEYYDYGDTKYERAITVNQSFGQVLFGYIILDTPYISIDSWRGTSVRVTFEYSDVLIESVYIDNGHISISDSGMTDGIGYIDLIVDSNNTNEDILTNVIIVYQEQLQMTQQQTTLLVSHSKSPYIEYLPIYKDCFIEIEGEDGWVNYQLIDENTDSVFYSGKAYFINGKASVRINDIVRTHIAETIDFEGGIVSNNAYKSVLVNIQKPNDVWIEYRRYKFFNDWSYEEPSNVIISSPIRAEFDERQYIMCSFCDINGEKPMITKNLTSTTRTSHGLKKTTSTIRVSEDLITDITLASRVSNINYVVGDGEESIILKRLENSCNRYCIYYQNLKGGFDWFIFKGKCIESYSTVDGNFKRNIDNKTINHGLKTYEKQITRSWKLSTDYLSDRESELFKNVYLSPLVFLHDMADNRIYPVNITDKKFDVKTFKNQNRKFYTYSVNCELSQDRLIK